MSQPASTEPVTVHMVETLYRAEYRRFLGLALGMLGDWDLAHDAVQETFARAVANRRDLRSIDGLAPWLWRVLTNLCQSDRHLRSVESSADLSALESQGVPSGGSEWPELSVALSLLPRRQRLMVFLRHYADLDYITIAEIAGVERGTVAATLHAAHAQLHAALVLERR